MPTPATPPSRDLSRPPVGRRVWLVLGAYYNHIGIGSMVVLLVLLWRAISPHGADVDARVISVSETAVGTHLGVCIYAPLGRDVLHGIFEIMMTERTVIVVRQ